MSLSAGEQLRLRRALLRFQLYTQLFHQPGLTESIDSDKDWEKRHLHEYHFWIGFESIEVVECKCIYALLQHFLVLMRDEPPIAHCSPTASTQRGLLLLQPVLSGAPLSPLMSSYAQRFVECAFSGLDYLYKYRNLPYRGIWDRGRKKRYLPSEGCREGIFGINGMLTIDWRLIGYCFWDVERLWHMQASGLM